MIKKEVIVITGTPGIDKKGVAKKLAKLINYSVIDISKLKGITVGYDKKRGCDIIDMKKVVKQIKSKKRIIVSSHLGHYLPKKIVGLCVVLRLHPKKLKKILMKRKYSKKKISANLEVEMLDLILIEAVQNKHKIHEIDTTKKSNKKTAEEILKVLNRKKKQNYGAVNLSNHIFSKNL
jgi:broad-specificity NMP kinase